MSSEHQASIPQISRISRNWMLADFLSTYRFWALVISIFSVAAGRAIFSASIARLIREADLGYDAILMVFNILNFAWIFGALVTFIIVPRAGRLALLTPLSLCCLPLAAVLLNPDLATNQIFLGSEALAFGMVPGILSTAVFVYLNAGRASSADFASAVIITAAAAFLSFLAPLIGALLGLTGTFQHLALVLLGLLCFSLLVLLPCRRLAFNDTPRPRHLPLEPCRRSPWLVVIVTALPTILAVVAFSIAFAQSFSILGSSLPITRHPLFRFSAILLLLGGGIIASWLYRIHGELAGAEPSQRLLTPLFAAAVGIFVPFGLLILIMTLGDLLNDRARAAGRPRAVSIPLLSAAAILLPPLAMAMIQNAANRSYASC